MPRAGSNKMRNLWVDMRQRCNNPNYRQWKDYGGRGIAVRYSSFEEFIADVGERPDPKLTIDRIDNDGDYAPGNVRWATRAEQQRNRRNPVFVEIDGEKHRLMDLAKQSGFKPDTIKARVQQGLSMAEVLAPERRVYKPGLSLGGKASGAKIRERTHCPKGHEYTAENTQISSEGWRRCRACGRLKSRRQWLQKSMGVT